jgi:hypothetical protein
MTINSAAIKTIPLFLINLKEVLAVEAGRDGRP